MSAESGVPTYRGEGGIWHKYDWQSFACQIAFDRDPDKVLEFHQLRREKVGQCPAHRGHAAVAAAEHNNPHTHVVTQNIDGLHQRAGSRNVVELHGSLWRMRCPHHGLFEAFSPEVESQRCPHCDRHLRPDITWFGDELNGAVFEQATSLIRECDLFVSIGTSGVVYPAAALPELAHQTGATMVWINPEPPRSNLIYDHVLTAAAGELETLLQIVPVEAGGTLE